MRFDDNVAYMSTLMRMENYSYDSFMRYRRLFWFLWTLGVRPKKKRLL